MITMNVSEELISVSGFNASQKSIIVSFLKNLNNSQKISFISYTGKLSKLELVRDVMNIFKRYIDSTHCLGMAIGFIDKNSTQHEKYRILDLPMCAIYELQKMGIVFDCWHDL